MFSPPPKVENPKIETRNSKFGRFSNFDFRISKFDGPMGELDS